MNQPHTLLDCPHPSAERGFSLVELLVALAVLTLSMTFAVPALGSMVDSMRLTTLANRMLSELQMTRGEAIKRNGRAVLCKSADGASCAATGGWEQGWISFHDANNNGLHDPSETVVYREQSLPGGFRVTGNQNVARYVSYSPGGEARLLSGAFQAGTITLCHESAGPTEARQIVINAVGRPRVLKTTVPSCL